MVNQIGKPGKPANAELRIVKHGSQERATITIPLVVGVDDDLIKALNRIPKDSRQWQIKSAMRSGMDMLSPREASPTMIADTLLTLLEHVEWIVGQMTGLKTYLDEKFAKIGLRPVNVFQTEEEAPADGTVSPEVIAKRKANAKKARW
jgi:hypothetical protein